LLQVKKGAVVVDTQMDYSKIDKDFKNLEKHTEKLIDKYNKSVDSIKSQELAIQKVKDQIETLQSYKDVGVIKETEAQRLNELNARLPLLQSKLSQTKEETNEVKKEIKEAFDKRNVLNLGKGVDEVGKKIDKFKNRMSRLIGTAFIFSLLRSSLTNLRNGFISMLKSNDQFSSSLNQIKANLMTAFAPIYNACLPAINSLMNALSKLTGTIAMFVSGLFGQSLNDAKKQAQGLSKSLDKTAKSGEKASGSLASFDKLEVINESSSGGSSDSGSGIDYSGEIQYSQKLLDMLNRIKDFVVDNAPEITAAIGGITGALIGLKFLGLDPIQSLGLGIIITGIIYTIQSLIKYLNDPSFENFGSVIQGIGIAIIGLGILIGGPAGLTLAIIGACILVLGTIIKYWDKIKAFLQKGIDWLTGKSDWVHQKFGDTIGGIYDYFVGHLQRVLDWLDLTFTSIKGIFDGIIKFIKGVFTGDWKMAWEGIKQIFANIWNWISGTAKLVLTGLIEKVKTIASTIGNIIGGVFKAIVNAILSAIENILNTPINSINKLIDKLSEVPVVKKLLPKKLSTFKLPRLATGAVIPPRQEFAAILGDQKHGTNIETPAKLMSDIFDERLEHFFNKLDSLSNDVKEIVFRNLTIVAQFGNRDFQKLVIDAVRLTEKEIGRPLFVS